ncbi:MAG TPA: hypothetical protein VJT75_17475 [Thermoleophilaceae bacterium]|nr:hypothetical protein [Thermoleophilaceae bacterium]
MSEQGPPTGDPGREPTEEELRAAYEAEIKRMRIEDIIVQTIVSLVNLGGRRAGFVPGAEDERDLDQVRLAVEGVRALLPLIEAELGPEASTIRDALAQLQMMYARASGAPTPEPGPEGEAPPEQRPEQPPEPPPQEGQKPGEPGPAQRSGRLWIPGQ